MKAAGGVTYSDPNMQWMNNADRHTGVEYQGIKNSDEELTKAFREKLAARGARGLLGMQRIFKVMDDNRSGTLDI
jgi:hypothetical protein